MSETMRAALLKDIGHFEVEQVAKPQITNPDDVLIKVLVCSICGTDVALSDLLEYAGKDLHDEILGHELVGEVVEIGSGVTDLTVGQRVVVNPNSYCCKCPSCRAGYRNHCENMELMGITVNGGFAEYVKTKEFLAFPISDKVPLNHAAFAEPLSCAMNGFSRLNITPGDTCVVFGCGPIGLLFAQLARASGARVACVEVKENRMAKARELGFDVYAAGPDVKDKLIEKWGRRANFCIDAAGRQLVTAIDYAEYRGTILCFAGPRTTEEGWSFSPIQNKELTVMGSFIINDSMAQAITVLECGILDLDPLVTHVLPLEELNKGIELMKSGEGMEIIMEINK
jgi:threonine dehydrogenase-like Zn-dependent dehydrogenase